MTRLTAYNVLMIEVKVSRAIHEIEDRLGDRKVTVDQKKGLDAAMRHLKKADDVLSGMHSDLVKFEDDIAEGDEE